MTRVRTQITVATLLGLAAFASFVSVAGASRRSTRAAGAASWSAPVRADWGLHGRHVRALTCPSEKFCAAVDEVGDVVFYRGSSWTRPAPVDVALKHDDVLLGISCTYKGFCVTFNAQGDVFLYDGHRWSQPSSLWSAGIYDSGAVSCPSRDFCMLENGHRLYLYSARKWSAGPRLKATGLSCSSSRFCVVTSRSGTSWYASTYRAKLGKRRVLDRGSAVNSLSCASSGFCVAAGAKLASDHADGGGTVVTYRGHSWSSPHAIDSARTGPTSVSCPSNKFCAAVDAAGNALLLRSGSWTSASPVDAKHAKRKPVWVSCPSSSFCMAVDSTGYAVRYRAG
jgi:hypothetical protein